MEQLVQRDRSKAYNHRALGKLYHRVGKFENAIAAFREVAALEPDNLEGFYTIATSHWEKAFRDAGDHRGEQGACPEDRPTAYRPAAATTAAESCATVLFGVQMFEGICRPVLTHTRSRLGTTTTI